MKKKKPTKKPKAKKGIVVVGKPNRRGKLTPKQKKNFELAVKGNHWWELRSIHGREKIFAEPDLMWSEALKYFQWCNDNPEKKAELVKYEGGAYEHGVSVKRLYTMQGLCLFLNVNTAYFRQFKAALRAKGQENWTQKDMDFSTVIQMIEDTVENQQVSGAASGFFNGNIISRLVGLVDKKDITSGDAPIAPPLVKVYNTAPPLAGSEDEIKD